jgi:acyl-CoA synthetase (AMP-forming)/AMP-acid ligase II
VVARDSEPIEEDALKAFCRSRLAQHKLPSHWFFRPALPKTGTGKIDKTALRGTLSMTGAPSPALLD